MSFSRAFQWYHSHLDPIWPDGTFKEKLRKPKSVLWRMCFRYHREVEAPLRGAGALYRCTSVPVTKCSSVRYMHRYTVQYTGGRVQYKSYPSLQFSARHNEGTISYPAITICYIPPPPTSHCMKSKIKETYTSFWQDRTLSKSTNVYSV